jgi:hypothetical protein
MFKSVPGYRDYGRLAHNAQAPRTVAVERFTGAIFKRKFNVNRFLSARETCHSESVWPELTQGSSISLPFDIQFSRNSQMMARYLNNSM